MGLAALASQNWLEAQHSVLGSMLIDPRIVPDVLSQMQDSDFNGPSLAVYQAFRHLFAQGQSVDVISVANKLGPEGGEMSKYLMQLMEITPTSANYRTYIRIAREQSKIVQLQELGRAMSEASDIAELQELLQSAVALNTEQQGMRAISMREALNDFVQRMQNPQKTEYLKWFIPELDKLLFAQPGDFLLIGGRPSAGKTAFALQCAWDMASRKRTAFFSLETGQKKLTDRQISTICNIPLENIKLQAPNKTHWDSIIEFGQSKQPDRTFDIIVQSSPQVSDIATFARAKQYEVIFIDYIQLMEAYGSSPYEKVTQISKDLHRFAQTSECAVVALAQLNRAGDDAGKYKHKDGPDMTSLKDSGQLEQDADAILFLYLEDEKNYTSRRILKCAKNKDGERFRMLLDFDGKYQRFSKARDLGQFKREMGRIAREQKAEERYQKQMQMQELPMDTPVPFEKGEKT